MTFISKLLGSREQSESRPEEDEDEEILVQAATGSEARTPNPPRGANLAVVPEQDRPRAALHTRQCVCPCSHL